MFQNYPVNFKTINTQFFFFYFIFVLLVKCCFCTTYDNTYFSDFGDEKRVSINTEEIIRRRNVAKNYLKEIESDAEKDWIETYHGSFSGSSAFISRKTEQESSIKNEHDVHGMFSLHNEEFHSLKNLDDPVNLRSGKFFVANTKDETASIEKDNYQALQESFTTDENCNENPHSLNNNDENILNVSIESSESSKIIPKNIETVCNYKDSSVKKSTINFEERISPRSEHEKTGIQKNSKDWSVFDNKETLSDSLEWADKNYYSYDSEILRRKKLMESFVMTLGNNQENWIESYHLSDVKNKLNNENTYNSQKIPQQIDMCPKVHSQERQYILRWINKLQNKMKGSHIKYHSLSILVSADLYKILGELSQEFDLVIFDELVNNIISNATLHNYGNTFNFDYNNYFNYMYLLFNNNIIIYIFVLLFCYILVYCAHNNFALHNVISTFFKHYKRNLFLIILVFTLYWNGYKMYQQKIVEKHSVMSHVVPSYCESILVKETGVFAHVKEYFRHWWHNEDCKKYYEALMVDPSSEITLFSISTDLLFDAIFQILQPLARNTNTFFKVLTYNLSYPQTMLIFIVVTFIIIFIFSFSLSFLAFYRNYKVNFPFNLGSVEPTEFCKGSRVEEIEEKETLKDSRFNCDSSLVNYNNKSKSENYTEDVVSKGNMLKIKPRLFKLKYHVLKSHRIRHNSI